MTRAQIRRPEDLASLDAVKRLADAHRPELGFHTRQALADALRRHEILIASVDGQVVGFLHFHHTLDHGTTLRELAVDPTTRRLGVGRQLCAALVDECRQHGSRRIRLSCPADLPANDFYRRIGFRPAGRRGRTGKSRPLCVWELAVDTGRPPRFVASLTNSANDLRHLIPLWEREGTGSRPFDACIVTPLFVEPRSLGYVRHLRDRWGVDVWFDSGGFFVQQGKIRYEQLFARLLDFYQEHDWAAVYVLPDYVPTSRSTPAEVEERVRVTASEGVKFLHRMPAELRPRALGALQGFTSAQLTHCVDAFQAAGVRHVGFGSFDTTGVNSEINLLTHEAAQRLMTVRALLDRVPEPPTLHLFGVGSPALLGRLSEYRPASFDSSGWLRTAGFGNVYSPGHSRRNVTHGASALTSGTGLTAATFYAACESAGHDCPFCRDFERLQRDRFARMWHNALVITGMTQPSTSAEP